VDVNSGRTYRLGGMIELPLIPGIVHGSDCQQLTIVAFSHRSATLECDGEKFEIQMTEASGSKQ
jgi:hypothetical protein